MSTENGRINIVGTFVIRSMFSCVCGGHGDSEGKCDRHL